MRVSTCGRFGLPGISCHLEPSEVNRTTIPGGWGKGVDSWLKEGPPSFFPPSLSLSDLLYLDDGSLAQLTVESDVLQR